MSADNESGSGSKRGCLSAIYTENRTPPVTPNRCRIWSDRIIIGLALLSLIFLIWHPKYIVSSAIFRWSMLFIDGYFILDYILRIIYTGRQSSNCNGNYDWLWKLSSNHYTKRWYGLADLATAIAGVCAIILILFPNSVELAEYAVLPRMLRLFRIGRVLHSLRNIGFFNRWMYVLQGAGSFSKKIYREIIISVIGILIVVLLCSFIIMTTESDVNTSFADYYKTFIWSLFSLFGQSDPDAVVNVWSKITALLIVFAGLVLIGLLTGSMTTLLQDKVDRGGKGQLESHENQHLLVCGWNSKVRDLLLLLEEGKYVTKSVVLLFDRGNEEEESIPRKLINKNSGQTITIQWVRGNPRNHDDLEKASYRHADKIIVLGDHEGGISDELDVDARTLMVVQSLLYLYEKENEKEKRGCYENIKIFFTRLAHSICYNKKESKKQNHKISMEIFTESGNDIAEYMKKMACDTELCPVYGDKIIRDKIIKNYMIDDETRNSTTDDKESRTGTENQASDKKYQPHVLVCGWNWTAPEIARGLARDYAKEEIVFLFKNGLEKEEETKDFRYATCLNGNPRDRNDLAKIISDDLENVIILADRSGSYESQLDVDARTLMTMQNIELLIREEKLRTKLKYVKIEFITHNSEDIAKHIKERIAEHGFEVDIFQTDKLVANELLTAEEVFHIEKQGPYKSKQILKKYSKAIGN